jgi:hypothetical protein
MRKREGEKQVGIRMEPGRGVLPVGKKIKAPGIREQKTAGACL